MNFNYSNFSWRGELKIKVLLSTIFWWDQVFWGKLQLRKYTLSRMESHLRINLLRIGNLLHRIVSRMGRLLRIIVARIGSLLQITVLRMMSLLQRIVTRIGSLLHKCVLWIRRLLEMRMRNLMQRNVWRTLGIIGLSVQRIVLYSRIIHE